MSDLITYYLPLLWGAIGGFFAFLYYFKQEWVREKKERKTPNLCELFKVNGLEFFIPLFVGAITVFVISISTYAPIWQILVGGFSGSLFERIFLK